MAAAQYLLDGQQRLTSLHRVFRRHEDADIVFNVENERFQVQSALTAKDARWVRVADVLEADRLSALRREVCEAVPDLDEDDVDDRLGRLKGISKYEYYLEILTELSYRDVASRWRFCPRSGRGSSPGLTRRRRSGRAEAGRRSTPRSSCERWRPRRRTPARCSDCHRRQYRPWRRDGTA